MSLGKRFATAILRMLTGILWGEPPLLIETIVEHLGGFRALRWFAKNLPPYESTMKLLGPRRTHLLCIEASLLNGCAYCVHAHAYAFQLYYFGERKSLFPLDEHAMVALRDGTDAEVREKLHAALEETTLTQELADFNELWAMKFSNAEARDDLHHRIRHILSMFETLNYCGIDAQTPFDHAHDPINKDAALKLRYAEARLASAAVR